MCAYIYDLNALAGHVRSVVAALPARCRMFYAMKANSAEPLLQTLAPIVAGFEVASAGELAKARAAAPDAPVIMGGPAKTERAIAAALAAGVRRLHVESVLELHRVAAVATRLDRTAEVLLRVNLTGPFPEATLAMAGRPTQFGIQEPTLPAALQLARETSRVRVVGFHLHSVSNNLSARAHLAMLAHYRDKVLAWEERFGLRCEVLNLGGGIGIDYTDPTRRFDWAGFSTGLGRLVRDTFPRHWQEIDFECGRYLVADCGQYLTEVLDIKRNHGVTYLLVRGGTHHFRLPVSWQHSHPFTVLPVERWGLEAPRPEAHGDPVTVVGELCTPKDVLAGNVPVQRVRAGDVLAFQQAGAYGWEISHHDFLSQPHPEQVFFPVSQG
ncbi:type III PLP-dependent enzyme [Amycolatopsis aidingensis]|uniref:type III PLP-dependent enzyme n=1 Tax=Amycolatopsis aidingensis TaxID=2842453 RepID=UPI001E5A2822|nr:type III PLP-dependent enzyme [Amycolatopsis aidingensis]